MTARLLLAGASDGPLARQLVREQIGSLVDYDATHGSEFVRTLRVYLAHASSKVQTAEALRLRRQTLYGRLQRIEELIGDIFRAAPAWARGSSAGSGGAGGEAPQVPV